MATCRKTVMSFRNDITVISVRAATGVTRVMGSDFWGLDSMVDP